MSDYPTDDQRRRVYERSHGRCEALVQVPGNPIELGMVVQYQDVWTRCFDTGVEVHHALLRRRGGTLLDQWGEIYHLIALCHRHHRNAHSSVANAVAGGLIIPGEVVSSNQGYPVYHGVDPYLSLTYPERDS